VNVSFLAALRSSVLLHNQIVRHPYALQRVVRHLSSNSNVLRYSEEKPSFVGAFQELKTVTGDTGKALEGAGEAMKEAEDEIKDVNDIFVELGSGMDRIQKEVTGLTKKVNGWDEWDKNFKEKYFHLKMGLAFLYVAVLVFGAYTFLRLQQAQILPQSSTPILPSTQPSSQVILWALLDRISQEVEKLQTKYNDSYFGSWLLSWISRGYSCQAKMVALVTLEQEILRLSKQGTHSISFKDVSQETRKQLEAAYSYSQENDEEEFIAAVLKGSLQLSM
jgi:hypothetical protein